MKKINQKGFSVTEGLLALAVLVLLGGVGWYVYSVHHKTSTSTAASRTKTASQFSNTTHAKSQFSITPGPVRGWETYTNNVDKFSIQVPQESFVNGGSCNQSTTINNNYGQAISSVPAHYWSQAAGVPTTVINAGNDFFVTGSYSYQLGGQSKDNNGNTIYLKCDKVATTTSMMSKSNFLGGGFPNGYASYPVVRFSSFNFAFYKVANQSQLNSAVRAIFNDPSLTVTSTTKDSVGNWEDLSFSCSSARCAFTGGSYRLRYYPTSQDLVFWSTGQGCQLSATSLSDCADQRIIDSFKILD